MADAPPAPDADEPYQSLYRRYRPQRFEDVRGQEHITRALRNAVRDDRVAHAYLFSGPRGTGKTSTARILAMALNCAHPIEGEPDGTCPSCVDIRRGASLDVQELDAASNRKLDEMRDLLSRVALGTRGRWKVYIVDEVHQLTTDASSALLKTLEEPPAHVVFVLATTDPQKVLPTIRSRTQHFEFRLLGAEVLTGLLRDVNDRAALGLPPEAIDLVVRRGHGSARDALSVLDQVAAAGEVEEESGVTVEIAEAIADQDAGRILVAVAEAMSAGRDPRRLAVDLLEHLRNGFLATQARGLVHLSDDAVAVVEGQARRLGLAGVVRAMEVVGQAAGDMRDSVDPRVTLEVALVRLAAPRTDSGGAAVLRRLVQLEEQVAALTVPGSAPPVAVRAPPTPRPSVGALAAPGAGGGRSAPVVPPAPAAGSSADPPAARSSAVPEGRVQRGGRDVAAPAVAAPGPGPGVAAPAVAGPGPGPAGRPPLGAAPPLPGRAKGGPPAPAGPGPGRADGSRPALGAHRRGGAAGGRTVGTAGPVAAGAPAGTGSPVAAGGPAGAVGPAAPGGPPEAGGPAAPGTPGGPPEAGGPGAPGAPGGPSEAGGPAAPGAPGGAAGGGPLPTRDELVKAWGDEVLAGLRPGVKAYVSAGRFVEVAGSAAVYALPDQGLLARAGPLKGELEAALGAHFGRPVPIRLVLDGQSVPVGDAAAAEVARDAGAGVDDDDPSSYDLDDLADADLAVVSPEQRLLEAFPGAEEVIP